MKLFRNRSEEKDLTKKRSDAKKIKKIAFLDPGQGSGSVFVGMGLDLWLNSPKAREVFTEADERLGRPFSQLCFFGPEEELLKTANAQLACFITSTAYSRAYGEFNGFKGENADFFAGHSAGLYAAYVEGGVISFPLALRIVDERGKLMDEACRKYPGKMIILLNPRSPEEVMSLVKELGLGGLYNSSSQIVLSGSLKQIEDAKKIINEKRLGRIFPEDKFKTQGAFHSPCMEGAKKYLAKYLSPLIFNDPAKPIIANSKAKFIKSGEEAKQELIDHMDRMVYWHPGMELLVLHGTKKFIEVGSGEVLTNNLKRSFGRKVKIISLSSALRKSFSMFFKKKPRR